jgi:hypothetical protein
MNRFNKVTLLTAFLICLSMVTGSLVSCGPVPFALGEGKENAGDTAPESVIEVESMVDAPQYYTSEDETVYQEDEITLYSVDALSNDESSGTVEYETGYLDGLQTLTASATPAEGRVLDYWTINGEKVEELGNSSPVSVTDITGNVSLEAVFSDPDNEEPPKLKASATNQPLRAPLGAPLAATPTALPTPTGAYTDYAHHRILVYVAPEIEDLSWGTVSGGYIGDRNLNVTASAIPNPGYEFDHWHIIEKAYKQDGSPYPNYSLDYELTDASTISIYQGDISDHEGADVFYTWCFAFFRPKGAHTIKVINDPPSGGTSTVQEQGGKAYSGQAQIKTGNTAVITAKPAKGYKFDCFVTSSGTRVSGSENGSGGYTLTINDVSQDVTITAKYKKISDVDNTIQPSGRKTDLVNEHFYNEKRHFTEPDYTVTRQTMVNLAAISVSYDKLRNVNDLQGLHSYGAVASVRDYFDSKLSATDIVLVEGILTTTKGEVIPIEKIQDIDALMNAARTISLKKYGNMYDSEIVAAVYTNPPEEFDGQVRTYLWKETGAKKGDNIYVMYRDKDSIYREMSAVVDVDDDEDDDDEGTVRFTLEDALTGTEFVLVRVNIESTQ